MLGEARAEFEELDAAGLDAPEGGGEVIDAPAASRAARWPAPSASSLAPHIDERPYGDPIDTELAEHFNVPLEQIPARGTDLA